MNQAHVLKEDIYLLTSLEHRLASRFSIQLQEAADESFIGYKEDFVFQKLNETMLGQAGVTPRYVCRVDEPAAISSLVRAGIGVALTGCKTGRGKGLALIKIEDQVMQYRLLAVWSKNRYFSKAALKFRDFMLNYYADLDTGTAPAS